MAFYRRMTAGWLLFLAAAYADIHTDIAAMRAEAELLQSSLAALSISQAGSCATITAKSRDLQGAADAVEALAAQMPAFTLSASDLDGVDAASLAVVAMAQEAQRLSWELNSLSAVADLSEYRTGLAALLQLSRDIGTMADRILEMADRILIMADNIGLMADRILLTQQIQNSNIALTQTTLLATQTNLITLNASLSTIAYNLTLGQLKEESLLLQAGANAPLESATLMPQLDALTLQSAALLGSISTLSHQAVDDSAVASHYINGDTLTLLGDLSTIDAALGVALERYAQTITSLAPQLQTPILSEAINTMLQLSADIKRMSGRIVLMSEKIITMADNIGLMAGRIVTTQRLQKENIVLLEQSIAATQITLLTLIKAYGL